jgi:hypothetical protein
MPTIRLKGSQACNFIAQMMVEDNGEKALEKCAKDSPIYKAVKQELELRQKAQNKQEDL